MNVAKTRGPAIAMVILGLLYHSRRKICSLDPAKVTKYSTHIDQLLGQDRITSKDLERMVGRLEFAAWVEPFGRPLLTFLSAYITPSYPHSTVPVTKMMKICLRVWHLLLSRNRGLHFSFILGKLPRMTHPFLVDASLTGGIGGVCGLRYFSLSIAQLKPYLASCDGWGSFPDVDIAWLELLAACTAVYAFAQTASQRLLTIYSDNTNVVAWLSKRRAPSPIVCAVVAAIERVKYEYILKISTRYISTRHNKTADRLSRGDVPSYLYTRGTRISPPMKAICANLHLENIENLWSATIKNAPSPTQA